MTYTKEQVIAAMELSEIDEPYQDTVLSYLENVNKKYKNLIDSETVIKIFDTIYQVTGIDREQIEGKRRKREIVMCRHMAAFLIKKYTDYILKDIGSILGKRHYSTVINSLAIHSLMVETKSNYYKDFYEIENTLNTHLEIMNQR